MSPAAEKIPSHLKRYVVDQNYSRYTPEDHAVWRFIMRQLINFLSEHAHPCYVEGLKRTGISAESIPRIEEMDKRLEEFGWGAVPVSGFIPPAAFMEFQSLSLLPIASDMRTMDHLLYTPAPDIVHEAAGHAPILVEPAFAEYLRRYASVASNAIISREDLDQYEAIRELSDIKENPSSTTEDIRRAEKKLEEINSRMTYTSEAGLLSRMNWWTAEYGLIGPLKNPRIFGAGLLSSVGESQQSLSEKVKKIPLDIHCIDFSYDITEQQPQLFVTPDFESLYKVLDQLAEKMAFRRGGAFGLEIAKKAHTVNTVELNSGLQISGVLENFEVNGEQPIFIKLNGPTQLSVNRHELAGHGKDYHQHGFSSPIGLLEGYDRCLSDWSDDDLKKAGFVSNQKVKFSYRSGFVVEGTFKGSMRKNSKIVALAFSTAQVKKDGKLYYDPAWGPFELAVGSRVTSVFGGPADRLQFGTTDDFVASQVPQKKYSQERLRAHQFYADLREFRKNLKKHTVVELNKFIDRFKKELPHEWLIGIELLELTHMMQAETSVQTALTEHLRNRPSLNDSTKKCIEDGIRMAPQIL